uniref:Regulation of nuclear pre-mRNA domain-containing protein 2 n=1 Tax=Pygocentrus nattereri TaxID=42514 RepID=A0A3B4CHL7_PYGNA
MAAGGEAVSGNSRGSTAVLESTLDRRFQGVTNTMESIQGLSTWCIENKKHHSVIVRYWIKWLRKSEASHRLNLFYLANDVIQNCKRKNAIVYRTTFTDVLPEAIKLVNNVKDSQVRKSVERILSIWEERNVYSEELIIQLRSGLIQREEPPAPVNPKAALRSKIVAEFVPSAFIEQLTKYRSSMDEIELREKQLTAMRVDVCSTTALKKLKDKAGGKRFSKDFEDGSTKLQDFVAFLDGQVKKGPSLMETLENADIFYEMQYKEVKIVTKAYQTFANRVLHLKRKLDAIKASLPDPNDSPVPSPVEDAPSPTGSESPFHNLPRIGTPDPELDGQAMEEDLIALGDAPSPLSSPGDKDNREVEDMELSDVEEMEGPAIIVEERVEQPDPVSECSESPGLSVAEQSQSGQAELAKQVTTPTASVTPTTTSLPINLAGVDLGKISSILSTLSNVMKNSGVSPASRSSASTSSTSTTASSCLKTPTPPTSTPAAAPAPSPLASMLSRVDLKPSTLLNALSKTQAQGTGLQDPTLLAQAHASPKTTSVSSTPPLVRGSTPQRVVPLQPSQSPNIAQTRDLQTNVEKDKVEHIPSAGSSLDSKIDNFLQVNPGLRGLNMGFPSVLPWPKAVDSPLASTENLGGTPVRDESGATPTQDEVMDDPVAQQFVYKGGPLQTKLSVATYTNDSWQEQSIHHSQFGPGAQNGGAIYQTDFTAKQDLRNSVLSPAEVGRSQPSSTPSNNQLSTESSETVERIGSITQRAKPYPIIGNAGDNAGLAGDGWYGKTYGDGQEQRVANSEAYGRDPFRSAEPSQDPDVNSPSDFFNSQLPPLPPIPQLPPPPQDFMPPAGGGVKDPTERLDPANEMQAGGHVSEYVTENPVKYEDYDERIPHQIQAKEPFHGHMNVCGPRLRAAAPRFGPPGPQNGPLDYNHRPRGPVHHQRHPSMAPHRMNPPSAVRGYHEANSPPHSQSEEPYVDPYFNHPPHSHSPRYDAEHLPSPQSHGYYAEDGDLPPRHPEHGLRPHLEHRPPAPHPYRAPHPGHYPPQRPLHRPPVPHMAYPGEPQFQRGKRHGPPFAGPRAGGVFYPPKRPFLPPRY